MRNFVNYVNLEAEVKEGQEGIAAEALHPQPNAELYDFGRNWRSVQSSFVHFQVRTRPRFLPNPAARVPAAAGGLGHWARLRHLWPHATHLNLVGKGTARTGLSETIFVRPASARANMTVLG